MEKLIKEEMQGQIQLTERVHKNRCPRCGHFHSKPTWKWCRRCTRNRQTGELHMDYKDRMRGIL